MISERKGKDEVGIVGAIVAGPIAGALVGGSITEYRFGLGSGGFT